MLYKYRAFISYRHSENGRRHAVALETALKRYAKPTFARPMSIFRDEKHMRPDISLPKLIREGLENSEFLIFLAERASAESQWCGEELEYWCGALQRTDRLIIVLVDDDIALNGTDGVHWEQTTALPGLLQPYLISIPLYVDLRWAKRPTDTDLQNPKYRQEINALAARLRGVNPEDLNDEEIRVFRRNIRLRNGAILTLLTLALLTGWAAKTANDNAKKAEAELDERKRQEGLKERGYFDKFNRDGNTFMESKDFDLAWIKFHNADSLYRKYFSEDKEVQKIMTALKPKMDSCLRHMPSTRRQ